MELRHLRYFLALAEELHFARAAARLGIEQSPLSRQIRDLEADLKVRLFHRTSRSTRLTPAGARLKDHGRRILDDLELSIADVQAFATTKTTPLRLGLAETAAGPGFEAFLRLCAAADPPLPVVLRERPAAMLLELLAGGALDALLTLSPTAASEFTSQTAWSEPLTLVTSLDQATGSGRARLRDQAGARWVLPDPVLYPGAAAQYAALLARHGVTAQEPLLVGSPQSGLRLLAAGDGVALLPCSLPGPLDDVAAHVLDEPDAVITTWIITRRDDPSPVVAQALKLANQAGQPA